MLKHIAFLKFKKIAFADDQRAVVNKLLGLKHKITDIKNCYGGKDYLNEPQLNKGYQYAVCYEFDNDEQLANYLQHPAQTELNDLLQHYLDDVILMTIQA